jgi:hypothetical protein
VTANGLVVGLEHRSSSLLVDRSFDEDREPAEVDVLHPRGAIGRYLVERETTMSSWGILVRGYGFDSESKCWRCLEETVPEEDELGLCDFCIASLQDQPAQP